MLRIMDQPLVTNRNRIPTLSLLIGASALGSVFRETQLDESIAVVQTAINEGINYIDTAPWYGQGKSEKVLGKVYVYV